MTMTTRPKPEPRPLGPEEKRWIAERLQQHCGALPEHPIWEDRLRDEIDNLLWSYGVDGLVDGRVVKDGWLPAGKRLRQCHFHRVPFTDEALAAFAGGAPKQVKREHIVQRSFLSKIIGGIPSVDDVVRVLDAYAQIALVTEAQMRCAKPRDNMPREWGVGVDWTRPPSLLPDPWPRHFDGRQAWT
jgi:hypothetical protein